MGRPEELVFRAGEVELAGTLLRPDGAGRQPWALLLPSWLPRGRDGGWDRIGHATWFADGAGDGVLRRLADALAAHGVASLRYDKRGCGASGGDWTHAALFTLIDDARDAIGAMRSRGDLDLRRTAVVGHGEGATIALSVAIGDPAISAVGLIGAPARSWRTVLRSGVAARARDPRDRRHPFIAALDRASEELIEDADRGQPHAALHVAGERVRLGLAYWEQAFNTPARALATMLHRAAVVAHGSEDRWAGPDESTLLVSALRDAGNAPRLLRFGGAGHDLTDVGDTGMAEIAAAVAERIVPRELPPVLAAIEGMGPSR